MTDATSPIRLALASQLEAALSMLTECMRLCPDDHWDDPVAKYPFWQVAYHTLCFVDCYLSPGEDAFKQEIEARRGTDTDFHPQGMAELADEYPSRRFEQAELLGYGAFCRAKITRVLTDGADPLTGPSGFSWLPFDRVELHVYAARHIQHHAGQLAAVLRRADVHPGWTKAGWRE